MNVVEKLRSQPKSYDFDEIYARSTGSKTQGDKRSINNAIASIGTLGSLERDIHCRNEVQLPFLSTSLLFFLKG